jgi:hypothetical protein
VTARLLIGALVICLGYFCIRDYQPLLLLFIVLGIVAFVLLMVLHAKVRFKKEYFQALVKINKDEISFLEDGKMPFENGEEFKEEEHLYCNDLDLFGQNSLFQFLNRSQLFKGKKTLGFYLKNLANKDEILQRQEAIHELSKNVEWRQRFQATAIVGKEQKETYNSLLKWANKDLDQPIRLVRMLAFVLPVALLGAIVLHYIFDWSFGGSMIQPLIIANLLLAFSQVKYIRQELVYSDEIKNSLKSYALLIKLIEDEAFEGKKLKALKSLLYKKDENASAAIHQLSKLYANLDNVNNPFGAIMFNALSVYHVHALHRLKVWKKKHASSIKEWMKVIGEFEALNSLANFAYNNNQFVFPSLELEQGIYFKDLGHPLISKEKRVSNSVSFSDHSFIILTGSNMSGKSTFLRSLGVSMVLGQMGAPVCASKSNIVPMPVLVSMRVSDNLSEGESFFFAEVKRLKLIMEAARNKTSFVLLDEILRGTNSDDKRTGTIEVIKNIIRNETIGSIATHDLKVCDTTNDYPQILSNKCFEVEIKNNELVFDYQLREGVCQNKSATFLMKKMEVI